MIYFWDGSEYAKRTKNMDKVEELRKAERPWDKWTSIGSGWRTLTLCGGFRKD